MFQEHIDRQDQNLDGLSVTLKKLKKMSQEMSDHFEMEEPLLDDLNKSVERTTTKVSRATKRTDNLLKAKSNDCCVLM